VPTLIKAFYKLKKKLPDAKIVKVGRPGSRVGRKGLLKLIDNLELQNDITFIDYVPETELPRYYNSADLFVFPSAYEGFGLPPLEAMACGVPVIASNAASLPEVVGGACVMKNPQDVDGFAKAMYSVLTDDGLRENMIKKGLKRARLFSWQKTAEKP
jgi:glycosyltransferase involved in cell wall biosynthesis